MNPRYLILLTIVIFHGLISYGQFDSLSNPKQVSVNPDLIIQVGAFHNEAFSSVLKEKLSAVIDKPVVIVTEDGFFKVRITGFSSQEEMVEFYSTLSFLGIKNFWVLPVKKQEEMEPQAVGQPDTTKKPVSESKALTVDTGENSVMSQPTIVLQVDVFHNESEAIDAKKRITTKLNLPVEIVQEWEYYKVFVTGFHTTDEANKYFSAIAKLGFPKITLIKNYKKN